MVQLGDVVIFAKADEEEYRTGRHSRIGWIDEMREYIGGKAVVTSLNGETGSIVLQFYDDAGNEEINFCVHVDDVRKESKVTLDKFFEL